MTLSGDFMLLASAALFAELLSFCEALQNVDNNAARAALSKALKISHIQS